MLSQLLSSAEHLIKTQPLLAIPVIFVGGGLITAANPCVLASIPLAIGFVGGYTKGRNKGYALLLALFLFLGIAATFTVLGMVAGLGRDDVRDHQQVLALGDCRCLPRPWVCKFSSFPTSKCPMPRGITPKTSGLVGAFLLGALTGVIASPCAMPILVVLLSYVAAKGNIVYGGVLLFTYALGHSVLVLAAGTSMGLAEAMVSSKGLKKASVVLKKVSGVLILLVGAYFVYEILKR